MIYFVLNLIVLTNQYQISGPPTIQQMSNLLVQGIQSKIYDLHTKDTPSIDMDCLKVLYGR